MPFTKTDREYLGVMFVFLIGLFAGMFLEHVFSNIPESAFH